MRPSGRERNGGQQTAHPDELQLPGRNIRHRRMGEEEDREKEEEEEGRRKGG